ncbi:MAG: TraB/GumN family protein [Spirochaetes bacterium]|nr:TraB/GumN family protein [Spirochaetota bacterium]
MKRLFILFLMVLFLFSLTSKDKKVKRNDLDYYHQKIGVGFSLPEEWNIYTKKNEAPAIFKNFFPDNKKSDESPLFLGMTKNQQFLIRCLVEKIEMDLPSYFKLLNSMIASEGGEVNQAAYYPDAEAVEFQYKITVGNLQLGYKEFLIKNENYFIRLSFWTLDTIFKDLLKQISQIEKSIYVSKPAKNAKRLRWKQPLLNLETLTKSNFDFIKEQSADHQPSLHKFNQDDQCVFYKVQGEKNTVYLLGSIHLGHPDFYPLPDKIEQAFSKSPNIAFEVNLSSLENQLKVQNLANNKKVILPKNKTLEDVLPQDLYDELQNKLNEMKFDIAVYENFQPWFVSIILNAIQVMSLGYVYEYGVDNYFLKKSADKKIYELETFEDQIKIFSEDLNEMEYLQYTLKSFEHNKKKLETLIKSWKKGDIDQLAKMVFTPSHNEDKGKHDKVLDLLYNQRNKKMASKIKEFLKSDQDYFVVIGAGHLIGEESILYFLENEGFQAVRQ